MQIPSRPAAWPRRGQLDLSRTAFVVVDMQYDFCDRRGYVGRQFSSLHLIRRPIGVIRNLLQAVRQTEMKVIYTRQGYRADLADTPKEIREQIRDGSTTIGELGPLGKALIRQQPGWQIVEDLKPLPTDIMVNKTANSAFHDTDLQSVLTANDIHWLVFTGNTIDVCVHSTLRSAVDRGYDCLLIEDACGAATFPIWEAAVEMVLVEDGVFGCVTSSKQFIEAIQPTENDDSGSADE